MACFEKRQIQMPLSRQVLHILEVHIEIPCELAQSKIMRIGHEQAQALERRREELSQPVLVGLRQTGDRDDLQIQLVLPVQRAAAPREGREPNLRLVGNHLDDVDVASWPFESEAQAQGETTDAVKRHGFWKGLSRSRRKEAHVPAP